MKVIDSHTHIFPEKIARKATENIGAFYGIPMREDGDLDILNFMEDIDLFVVHSSATKKEQVEPINNFIFDTISKNPKFVGLATFSPLMSENELWSEKERIEKFGLKGIKLHPDFQNFRVDDEGVYPLYEMAVNSGLPILFHAGDKRFENCNPVNISKVAKDFPSLKIVAAHFGGYSMWQDLFYYENLDNVFFDTSSSLPFMEKGTPEKAIAKFGDDKFFFGSDFPMWNPQEELGEFLKLSLSEKTKEKILWKNANEFYQLGL